VRKEKVGGHDGAIAAEPPQRAHASDDEAKASHLPGRAPHAGTHLAKNALLFKPFLRPARIRFLVRLAPRLLPQKRQGCLKWDKAVLASHGQLLDGRADVGGGFCICSGKRNSGVAKTCFSRSGASQRFEGGSAARPLQVGELGLAIVAEGEGV